MTVRDGLPPTSEISSPPLQVAALVLVYAALWLVGGRYEGLSNDAQIYALQAVAKLNPAAFGGDLYLKFGSQDDFTLFSNFTAGWIALFGIDYGVAALTLACIALWTLAAWLLARALVGSSLAWLAIGLLTTIPGWYGAGQVFQLVERYLSPRLPAEAVCLLALTALIRKRYALMGLCFAVALVIHPLMTVPCIAVSAVYLIRETSYRSGLPIMTLMLSGATLGAAYLLGSGSPLMTGDWLAAVRSRSDFLFLDTWTLTDWQLALLPLMTLGIAIRTSPATVSSRLAGAALCIAVAGLLATAFVSWVLPIKVAIQVQPWRWLWITTFLAIVLLPETLSRLWQRNRTGKACAALLANAWLLSNAPQGNQWLAVANCILPIATMGVLNWSDRLPASTERILAIGAALLSAGTLVLVLSMTESETSLDFDFGGDPFWLQRLEGVLTIPAMSAIAVIAAWLALLKRPMPLRTALVTIAGLVLLVAAAPGAWATWSSRPFGADTQPVFDEWRQVIGADQEVLWPEGLQWTWFVIGRRSYLTLAQLSGIVFSEETTIEGRRRAAALADSFPPGVWFHETDTDYPPKPPTSRQGIIRVCSAPDLDFYVSATNVGLAVREAEWPTKGMHVYLYDCGRLRQAAP